MLEMLNLQAATFEWVLTHFEKYGDNGIYPFSKEILAVRDNWIETKAFLEKIDLDTWQCEPQRRMPTPKGLFSYRPATQLSLFDSFLYTGLVYEVGEEFEKSRIEEDAEKVFSWRFDPQSNGDMFGSFGDGWKKFQDRQAVLAGQHKFVVVADIADFYPRLYHHPIENAIDMASPKKDHVRCLMKMLKILNAGVSYGIPVGNTASRLIAEVSINDVDQSLISKGYRYCRFVDDFRIFAHSYGEARERLAHLSSVLLDSHGLTLSSSKTEIIESKRFVEKYLTKHEIKEWVELNEKLEGILDNAAEWMDYPPSVNFSSLTPESQESLRKLNLRDMLQKGVESEETDFHWIKFLLMSLSQIGDKDAANYVAENLDRFYSVMENVASFFRHFEGLDHAEKIYLGNIVLDDILDDPILNLEFIRMTLLSVFSDGSLLGDTQKFISIYGKYGDQSTRREVILTLGYVEARHWFVSNRKNFDDLRPWERCAFMIGSNCMSGDERKYWISTVKGRCRFIEMISSKISTLVRPVRTPAEEPVGEVLAAEPGGCPPMGFGV